MKDRAYYFTDAQTGETWHSQWQRSHVVQWHRWYAWRPVWVVRDKDCNIGYWVWLEDVERKGYCRYDGIDWEYRPACEFVGK